MDELLNISHNDLGGLLLSAKRAVKAQDARDDLRAFIEYCMPDPEDHENPEKSLYDCWPHHELIIDLFVKATLKEELRCALSIPPQHGKTTICAQYGLAWYAARNMEKKIIYGTYSEPRAGIVGESVRSIMESERFKEVFPEFAMRKGSKSKDFIGFGKNGSIMFLGRNSGASGNPCDLFVIDDPFKDMREARSPAIRLEVWTWYCSVVEARCPAQTPVFIIHTRWSDDDLIGRLCDPQHPNYDAEDNDEFSYLNIPAIVHDPDLAAALGMEAGGALWPGKPDNEKWPLHLLAKIRKKNPTVFSAVFMGDPVPPSGDFYTTEMIKTYKRDQLPQNLIKYGASDHAVSTAKRADRSCIGCFGVCAKGEIWILPDLIWKKIDPVKQVDEMANLIAVHRPRTWWAEGDHIKKSILPFLKRVLRKRKLFATFFDELVKNGDKQQKAQSIRAMASMGMVHLPIDAFWCQDAIKELLRFDGSEGRPDDFCDFLANIGRGLDKMQGAVAPPEEKNDMPVTGTAAWIRAASNAKKKFENRQKATAGW